jgi:hypothetical protein
VTKKDIHAHEQVNFKELKCYLFSNPHDTLHVHGLYQIPHYLEAV